jgi:hypothetical protein
MDRKMLRDDQWERIEQLLPGKASDRGCTARTTGGLSRRSSGSFERAARGATFRPSSGIGTGHMNDSPAGARRVSLSALPTPCRVTLTWSSSSSTQPLCVPTSILPAPKKAGGQEIGRSRGWLTTKLHVAVDALGNTLRVILSAGQIADIECAAGQDHRALVGASHHHRQGIRRRPLHSKDRGRRRASRDSAPLQSSYPAKLRSPPLPRPQSDRTLLRSHQTFPAYRHALRQTRIVLSVVHSARVYLRLVG